MAQLTDIIRFCDELTRRTEVPDYSGARNGLQVENNGTVSHVGASVDAGLAAFREATERGVDLLIAHHGLFWNPPIPVTGVNYEKLKTCLDANLAVYGSHLPLDRHPEIGNNALLARELGLEQEGWFAAYEGVEIGHICRNPYSRDQLKEKLGALFPRLVSIEFGSNRPAQVAVLTGSGGSALPELAARGIDTLITGELSQHHYNQAQELRMNIFAGGHYATEVFGVQELARRVGQEFGLPTTFIESGCPL